MGIEIEGFDSIKTKLRTIANGFRHANPLMEKIGEELELIVNDSINSSKSATTGQSFKPITPTTARLENKNISDPPLKGKLNRIVNIKKLDSKSLDISISLPYFGVHQFGNPKNKLFGKSKAPIPRRPFLPITKPGDWTKSFTDRVNQITKEYIQNLLKK